MPGAGLVHPPQLSVEECELGKPADEPREHPNHA